MLRKWPVLIVFLFWTSDASPRDEAVELSVGGGMYFPSEDQYSNYFDGPATNFSLQMIFLGRSGLDFKLGSDYGSKTQTHFSGPEYFVHLYDLRTGFAFRLFSRQRLAPFLGGGGTVSEARGGIEPGSDVKSRSLGWYVEGGLRYRLTPRFIVSLEAWQDFRKGKVQSIQSSGPFSFMSDSSYSLGGTHVGLRVGVRLGK